MYRRSRMRLRIGAEPVLHDIAGNAVRMAGAIVCLAAISAAHAESLVVVEARGIASTAGTLIDSKSHLTLRPGEHVRLIAENGNQYCLDGPYDGPAQPTHAQSRSASETRGNLWNAGERDRADPLTDCIQ